MDTNRLIAKRWEITENRYFKFGCVNQLGIIPFVFEHEEYVTWYDMLDRSVIYGAVGNQAFAELLLLESEAILPSWREFQLVFPFTIWKSNTGHLHCPYLYYNNNSWMMSYYWFLYDFHHNDRFVSYGGEL
jgi:hypothetical protein